MFEDRYLEIVAEVDAEFERNRALHRDRIQCRAGCSECCHQLFRITPLDAERIATGVAQMHPADQEALRIRARRYIDQSKDLPPTAKPRLACPALVEGFCSIYEHRPLVCHKFGMPLFNPDKPDRIHACELNFRDGEEIRDPHLVRIQTDIHNQWKQLRAEYAAVAPPHRREPVSIAAAILTALPGDAAR